MDLKYRFGIIKRANDEPIPEDEPIFVLRARDYISIPTLQDYRRRCEADRCDPGHLSGIDGVIEDFSDWQIRHPAKQKQPGITRNTRPESYAIVERIIGDLTERRGLRHEWERIEPDTIREIVTTWCRLVDDALQP